MPARRGRSHGFGGLDRRGRGRRGGLAGTLEAGTVEFLPLEFDALLGGGGGGAEGRPARGPNADQDGMFMAAAPIRRFTTICGVS